MEWENNPRFLCVRGELSLQTNDWLFTGERVVSDKRMTAWQQDMCKHSVANQIQCCYILVGEKKNCCICFLLYFGVI